RLSAIYHLPYHWPNSRCNCSLAKLLKSASFSINIIIKTYKRKHTGTPIPKITSDSELTNRHPIATKPNIIPTYIILIKNLPHAKFSLKKRLTKQNAMSVMINSADKLAIAAPITPYWGTSIIFNAKQHILPVATAYRYDLSFFAGINN